MGKVTFKNRPQEFSQTFQSQGSVGGAQSRKSKRTGMAEDSPQKTTSNMLKTEEIREICDEHQLTRMEVYNIRSQYAAMVQMSRDREDEEKILQEAENEAKGGRKKNMNKTGGFN